MGVSEHVEKRIACDYPPCAHSEASKGTFKFFLVQQGQAPNGQPMIGPPPDLDLPNWVKNLRAVLVDNGTPTGIHYHYCSGQCESKAALDGLHDPHKKIDLADGSAASLQAAVAGSKAVAQMRGPNAVRARR